MDFLKHYIPPYQADMIELLNPFISLLIHYPMITHWIIYRLEHQRVQIFLIFAINYPFDNIYLITKYCYRFTSSILLKNSLAKKLEANTDGSALASSFLHQRWLYVDHHLSVMVEDNGIEPLTPCLQSRCSPSWANPPFEVNLVGLDGLEPSTPALSRRCSNQLSYRPC